MNSSEIPHDWEEVNMEETPEMLAAIAEADASPHDHDISAEQLRIRIVEWAYPKNKILKKQ